MYDKGFSNYFFRLLGATGRLITLVFLSVWSCCSCLEQNHLFIANNIGQPLGSYLEFFRQPLQSLYNCQAGIMPGYFQKLLVSTSSSQHVQILKLSDNFHSVTLRIGCAAFESEGRFSLVYAFFLFICRGRTITTQLFVVMGIAIGHILDGN